MIVNNNIKVFFNMRIHFMSPSCLSLHHPIQSLSGSKAQIKPITNISLLSILWAFLMLMIPSTTNAEALSNGDNHLTRSKIFEEQVAIKEVTGVSGGRAEIPCDLTPPLAHDGPRLILFYKDEYSSPIYSYDMRKEGGGKHWYANKTVGSRAYFSFDKTGMYSETGASVIASNLKIDPLRPEDKGIYRCRVDFQEAPTKNTKIDLRLIVPSGKPQILSSEGKELVGFTMPVEEGSTLTLLCETIGGEPLPRLTWWKGGGSTLVDSSTDYVDSKGKVVRNRLVMKNMQRNHQGEKLTCKSSNTNLTASPTTSVNVQMIYPPVRAKLVREWNHFVAGEVYNVSCQVLGSRPPAQTTIFIGSSQLREIKYEVSLDGNVATTTVIFIPEVKDQDKILYCRAKNLHVSTKTVEDQWKIKVAYPPRVDLSLTNAGPGNVVKVGDTVYLQCNVLSNPPVENVYWKFQGNSLKPGNGQIVQDGNILIITNVNRAQNGDYSCEGKNQYGQGRSKTLNLKVRDTPYCYNANKRTIIEVNNEEFVQLECLIRSSGPASDIQFNWYINSSTSGQHNQVLPSQYKSNGTKSFFRYNVRKGVISETIICQASNAAGSSNQPCTFIVTSGIAGGTNKQSFSDCTSTTTNDTGTNGGRNNGSSSSNLCTTGTLKSQQELLQEQPGEKQLAATTTGMDNRNAARFLPIMIVLISVVLLLIILSMIIILVLRSQMCRSSTTSLASATIEKEIVPSMDGSIHSTGTMNELLNTTLPTPDNRRSSSRPSPHHGTKSVEAIIDNSWRGTNSNTLDNKQCDKYPSGQHTPSTYRQQQRGTTFDCTDGDLGIGINHPLTYATIACVRRDGRYSRRPPRRQNSSETILPPPPSFYSADHPLIDDNQFTKEKRSQSNLSRTNKSGGTLRRVAFKDVPPCDSSSEDICTCSSNNSQQGIRKNSSSCTGNNYNINAVASYCASSADCTRSSTQNTDNNTRDQPKSHIRPYPDIINHNLDVGVVGRTSTSPEITSSLSGIMKHSQQHQPQYASVDKKNSKKPKQNPNDQQLIGIVKHKDPHQTSNQYQNQMSQEQPEVTYQKIHPSKYPTRPKTDTTPSIVKATAPKVDIIKTTYPDL